MEESLAEEEETKALMVIVLVINVAGFVAEETETIFTAIGEFTALSVLKGSRAHRRHIYLPF